MLASANLLYLSLQRKCLRNVKCSVIHYASKLNEMILPNIHFFVKLILIFYDVERLIKTERDILTIGFL